MPGMGGDTYHPMAFHPRGGGRAGGYFGSKEYPAVDPNSVGGGARGSGIPDNAGAGTGSCVSGPTAQGIDRSRFAKELANNPALKEKFFHIAAGEDSPGSKSGTLANQAIMESAMNRAEMKGSSLAHAARHVREGGYYAGWKNFTDKQRAIMDDNLKKVLAGSDVSGGATDNSSSGLAAKEKRTGAFNWIKDINGESFFSPGKTNAGGGRDRAHYNAMLAARVKRAAETHGASLRDHIRHRDRVTNPGGLIDRRSDARELTGSASLVVDFQNMPRGVRTSAKHDGLFKEVKLNRCHTMASASQDS